MTARMPCGAPLYGTCVSCVLVIWPKSTPDRWWLVPLPPEENVMPGLAFAAAMTSATVLAGLFGGTIITLDTPPTSRMGAKSLTES